MNINALIQQHKWIIPLIILVVALLIIFSLMATKPEPPKQEILEKEWLVSSEQLQFGSASPQITLLGQVESPFDATLSAAITADVLQVAVRDGQSVKKGEVLIELDGREIKLIINQRQSDVDELKAQIALEINRYKFDKTALTDEQRLLDITVQGVKRQAQLQASNLVAQERFDSAESQRAQQALSLNARKLNIANHPSRLNQLKAKLARAETNLNDAMIDAERAIITAPFDGVITSVDVSPGERVQIGQMLISLYDRRSIEVRAQIPDRYISLISPALANGTRINATTRNYGNTSQLQLERLSGQANRGSGGIDALFTPFYSATPDSSKRAKPEHIEKTHQQTELVLNSTLEIQVTLPPLENVVTLPLSAIYGADRIYRIEKGRIQSIDVNILGKQISPNTGQDRVIIQSPLLNNGDAIITTQLPNAISGLKVREREQ